MSKTAADIISKLKQITHRDNDTMIGTVTEIDSDKGTIEVDVDGLTYYEVQLKSIVKNGVKGAKVVPAKDSVVIVERIGKSNELFVTMCSEVESILWEIEDMKYFVDKDGFVFNDGNNKGMVKITELVEKLNNLENKVNQLVTWSSTHTHPVPSLGTSGTAVGVTGILTTTQVSDIENENVKH
ncbi:MAG TPA: hypothetical protein PK431_01710 [Chitinophagales bacterium]|nr:hypothetical protein [Chitinophagales bacterium]